MTFEQFSEKFARENDRYPTNRESWDAATTAANTRAGDAGNEAEKAQRLEEAKNAILDLVAQEECWTKDHLKQLRAIIAKAQG
jgi:hypothetical protein